jgi:hypothetical protein
LTGTQLQKLKEESHKFLCFFLLVAMYVCMVLFCKEYPWLNDFLT